MARATLAAGAAAVDITPAPGLDLGGGAFGPARGTLHRLEARVLYLATGRDRVVVAACDLLGFDAAYASEVRSRMAAAAGTSASRVMLTATHTHGAPATVELRNWGTPDAGYRGRLASQLAGAVKAAREAAEPARLAVAEGRCPGVARNRTFGPKGPVDDRVVVLRVDGADGRPLAAVVNAAVHPVNLHSAGRITPDYPYFTTADLRSAVGRDVPVLYLLGASGDLLPVSFEGHPSMPSAAETGGRIGRAAIELLRRAEHADAVPLAAETRVVRVPLAPLPDADALRAQIDEAGRRLEAFARPDPADWEWTRWKTRREWAEAALAAIESGRLETETSLALQAMRLGPAAVIGFPGELFAEFGRAVARTRGAGTVLVATLANGCQGYFPSRGAYRLGSYEAIHCPRYLGLYAFAPGVGERLAREAGQLLRDLPGPAGD